MSYKPWRATIYILASTPDDDLEIDQYADAITEHLEGLRAIGDRHVLVVKVPELELVDEQEFDDA